MLSSLFAPAPSDRAGYVDAGLAMWRLIGSPGFPFEEERVRSRVGRSFDRCFYPIGVARQLAALLSQKDRTADLGRVTKPSLVIHGNDDPLVNVSGGQATARAIPGAELIVIDGMGHDLPEPLWTRFHDAIAANAARAAS